MFRNNNQHDKYTGNTANKRTPQIPLSAAYNIIFLYEISAVLSNCKIGIRYNT